MSAAYPVLPISFGFVNGVLIGPSKKYGLLLYSPGFYCAFEKLKTVIQTSSVDGFFFSLLLLKSNLSYPLRYWSKANNQNEYLPVFSFR